MTSPACASATPSTSTAPKARPSPAPSSSPAAGRQARSPPTSRPPAPAKAPTGSSTAKDLGVEGHETDRIQRLAENMRRSNAQTPSLAHPELPGPRLGDELPPAARAQPHQSHTGDRPRDQPDRQPTSTTTNTMSQRVQVVPPDPAAAQLRELAAATDTSHSTLAAQLIQNEIARAIKNGHVRPLHSAPMLADSSGDRPPWLEPYGGDPQWRQQMWGAIVALRGRYPQQLEALKDKWWTDESTIETLAALTVWRAELDETRQDPPRRARLPNSAQRTTPNTYDKKAAASPRHGNPARAPPEWAGD